MFLISSARASINVIQQKCVIFVGSQYVEGKGEDHCTISDEVSTNFVAYRNFPRFALVSVR